MITPNHFPSKLSSGGEALVISFTTLHTSPAYAVSLCPCGHTVSIYATQKVPLQYTSLQLPLPIQHGTRQENKNECEL